MNKIITIKNNKIYELTLENENLWRELVTSNNDYDVYYLPEYVRAFEHHGDGTPVLYYYQTEKFSVLNVAMKRDIAKLEKFRNIIPGLTYFDLATPYGYGGFIVNGAPSELEILEFNTAYNEFCMNTGIVCEFVRFHPVLSNSSSKIGDYEVQKLGKTITIDLMSEEILWANLDAKNRNMIRKAIKNGVEIYWGRDNSIYEQFIKLYNQTMNRDNANDYYFFNDEFYKSVLSDLKYNSMIFYAEYKGEIIAASIILFANGKMNYHLSGSNREFQHLAPTNLLLYESSVWGIKNGFKTFHLGGGLGSKEDQLYKFKKVFNKKSDSQFYIGTKIFNEDIYVYLNSFVTHKKNTFFPNYRNA